MTPRAPDPTDCSICNEVGGQRVECVVCGRYKTPRGRSGPMESYDCEAGDCPGYRQDPDPGELWPGERYGDSLGHSDWHDEVAT